MAHQVVADYTGVSENANVKVFVRARPPEDGETVDELFELGDEEKDGKRKKLSMKQWKRDKDGDKHEQWGGVGGNAFAFDGVLWCEERQARIFRTICKEQVDHVLKGYNACCFAYGQTGSGKTHSMFFPRGGRDRSDRDADGLIPRAVDYLFSSLKSVPGVEAEVNVSFLEIYCDTLRDLGKASLPGAKRGALHGASTEKTSDIYQGAAQKRGETFGLGIRTSFSGNTLSKGGPSASSLSINTAPPTVPATVAEEPEHGGKKTGGGGNAGSTSGTHWYELKERWASAGSICRLGAVGHKHGCIETNAVVHLDPYLGLGLGLGLSFQLYRHVLFSSSETVRNSSLTPTGAPSSLATIDSTVLIHQTKTSSDDRKSTRLAHHVQIPICCSQLVVKPCTGRRYRFG